MADNKVKQQPIQAPDQIRQPAEDAEQQGGSMFANLPPAALRRRLQQRRIGKPAPQSTAPAGGATTPQAPGTAQPKQDTPTATVAPATAVAEKPPGADSPAPGEDESAALGLHAVDIAREEEKNHKDDWSSAGDLHDHEHNMHGRYAEKGYKGDPKCSQFVFGRVLPEAGMMTPGMGRKAHNPSTNELAATLTKFRDSGEWDTTYGIQWCDVVSPDKAQPGDLILISGADRDDGHTGYGHIEMLSQVDHIGDMKLGVVKSIGAGSKDGLREHDLNKKKTFGHGKGKGFAEYEFHPKLFILRPRPNPAARGAQAPAVVPATPAPTAEGQ